MLTSKKAIGPVIATALLILVAVVATVGFSKWFNSYQSRINTGIETQSDLNGNTQIDRIVDNTLYIKNGVGNITIKSVKISGIDCNISGNYNSSLIKLNVTDCLKNLTTDTPDIVVETKSSVISKNQYLEPVIRKELSCKLDLDNDGQISYTCANYPMFNKTLKGYLDPNDKNKNIIDDRCWLKGNKSSCLSNFVIDGCGTGTVLDKGTGLCWLRSMNPLDRVNWTTAMSYCENLDYAGHTNWHLPTIDELMTISDLSKSNPSIVGGTTIFTNVQNSWYWSASTYGLNSSEAWLLVFTIGYTFNYAKTDTDYLTCLIRD